MRFVEVEGKSKDDAMEKAARELGVPVEEIGIEILSDSGRGFFGFFADVARIALKRGASVCEEYQCTRKPRTRSRRRISRLMVAGKFADICDQTPSECLTDEAPSDSLDRIRRDRAKRHQAVARR